MKRLELTNEKFGRLTVLKFHGVEHGTGLWLCRCECGNEIICKGTLLKNGTVKSCGCLRRDMGAIKNKTHGLSNYRPYYIWKGMQKRCYNSSIAEFKNYGGRGIKICEEWKNDVASFCKWAKENGYKKGLTIDRINNDGDYEPSNCKWVSMKEQACNTRRNVFIEINGETKTISQWAEQTGIGYDTIYARHLKGHTQNDLIKPIQTKYRHKKERRLR